MSPPARTLLLTTALTLCLVGVPTAVFSPGDVIRDSASPTGTVLGIASNPGAVVRRVLTASSFIMAVPALVLLSSRVFSRAPGRSATVISWLSWLLPLAAWLFIGDWYPTSD